MFYRNRNLDDVDITGKSAPSLPRIRIWDLIMKDHNTAPVGLKFISPFSTRVCKNKVLVAHVIRQGDSPLDVVLVSPLAEADHGSICRSRQPLVKIATSPEDLPLQFARRILHLLTGWQAAKLQPPCPGTIRYRRKFCFGEARLVLGATGCIKHCQHLHLLAHPHQLLLLFKYNESTETPATQQVRPSWLY